MTWSRNDCVEAIEISGAPQDAASLQLRFPESSEDFTIEGLPLEQLVPRLHYHAATPADAFDAFRHTSSLLSLDNAFGEDPFVITSDIPDKEGIMDSIKQFLGTGK